MSLAAAQNIYKDNREFFRGALKTDKKKKGRNLKNPKAKTIRNLRNKFDLSQEKLANLLGISWVTVSRYERSKSHISDEQLKIINRISELLEISKNRLTYKELKTLLRNPHEDLYGDCPLDVLNTELGYRSVKNILQNLINGEYS